MEQSTEGEVKRWTAKRKAALVPFVVSTQLDRAVEQLHAGGRRAA